MSYPVQILVKESITELKKILRSSGELIGRRLKMLIEIKKHEGSMMSKRRLSELTGSNHNSITDWRKLYLKEGIDGIVKHGRKGGYKTQIVTPDIKLKLEEKLNDPQNGIRGYVELVDWCKTELGLEIKYITLVKYCQKNFGTKIKVARKSHVKKNDDLVSSFKKVSAKNVQ